MYKRFRDLNQIKGIVSLIPNKDVLEAFKWMNQEDLKLLVMPEAKVLRYKEGDFCSECNYQFKGEESDYHYCVNCLEELRCCDDHFCDKDNQRAEETVWSILEDFYKETRKH